MKDKKSNQNIKERIKQKAFFLIAKNGVDNTSVSEIASACGVTKPVLYYYFKDKEDLIYNIVAEHTLELNRKFREYLAADNSFEKFCLFVFTEYAGLSGYDSHDVLCFVAHISSYTYSHRNFEKRITPVSKLLGEVIFQAVEKEYKKGMITAKNKELAKHLILANIAHLILNNQKTSLKFPPSYPKDMVKALLRAINYKGTNK